MHWDEEVVTMPKYSYLERTPKAEKALGPFLLLIVFMVLFARFRAVQPLDFCYAATTSAPLLPTYIHTHAYGRLRGPSAFGPNKCWGYTLGLAEHDATTRFGT